MQHHLLMVSEKKFKMQKYGFEPYNFMVNVEDTTNTYMSEAQSRNRMNICIKYGFGILIISGSYGGHRR